MLWTGPSAVIAGDPQPARVEYQDHGLESYRFLVTDTAGLSSAYHPESDYEAVSPCVTREANFPMCSYLDFTWTMGESTTSTWYAGIQDYDSTDCTNGYSFYYVNSGASWHMDVIGGVTGTTSGDAMQSTPVPTSTYDGTYSELLPSVGWGTDAPPGASSTVWHDRMDSYFGTSTVATFPMCLVAPWWTVMDLAFSGTATGSASYLVMAGGLVPSTTAISLSSFPDTAAKIGLRGVTDYAVPFLEACAWLFLGLRVWERVMEGREKTETL